MKIKGLLTLMHRHSHSVRGDRHRNASRTFRPPDQERHAQLRPAAGWPDGGHRQRGAHHGVSAITSNDGSVVGLPNPLTLPSTSITYGSGTMAAGIYYVVFTFYDGAGNRYAAFTGVASSAHQHGLADYFSAGYVSRQCRRDHRLCGDNERRRDRTGQHRRTDPGVYTE